MENNTRNALAELAAELKRSLDLQMPGTSYYQDRTVFCTPEVIDKSMRIVAELAKVNHGEASPTPWRAHTDREVRANDERLWIEDVVCQTQSCPKTRYTKAEREEWNIPATANTKLIVASVNAVAECRAIAEEG